MQLPHSDSSDLAVDGLLYDVLGECVQEVVGPPRQRLSGPWERQGLAGASASIVRSAISSETLPGIVTIGRVTQSIS